MKVPRSSKSARSEAGCAHATTGCGGKSFVADVGGSVMTDLGKCVGRVRRVFKKVNDFLSEDLPDPVICGMRTCKNHDGNDKSAKRTKGLRRR